MTFFRPSFRVALVVAGLSGYGAAAEAMLYRFEQTGFEGGGAISGTFEAADSDLSGQIVAGSLFSSFAEISAFTLSFSGDSIVADFTHGLADLTALVFAPGDAYLGDGIGPPQEVLGTNWFGASGFDYASGMGAGGFGGSVSDLATGAISRTGELIRVEAVPAPATSWLLAAAVPGLLGFRRGVA